AAVEEFLRLDGPVLTATERFATEDMRVVDVHEAMDPVAVGRELQRVLVQFGRAQGTTVSLKLGG
ncbi:hypothetical protein, partial [Streptomyces prunicolor]|uniref:hypothetical protein n=1 Tax=Streptomyces prunicolor TaxID=67348 RepID=UPI0034094BC2